MIMENSPKHEPDKIKRFNFGAFAFPFLWSLFNRQYFLSVTTGILYFLIWHKVFFLQSYMYHSSAWGIYDIILLVIRLIMGIKGNRLAWKSQLGRKGDDADPVSFRQKQFGWSISGLAVIGFILFSFLFYNYCIPFFVELGSGNSYEYDEIDTVGLEPVDSDELMQYEDVFSDNL